MNAALKQRLVGAIVLVAFAVIVLPMLLDGSGTQENVAREVRIPEQPTVPEAPMDEVPQPVEADEAPSVDAPDPVPEEGGQVEPGEGSEEADADTDSAADAPAAEESSPDEGEAAGPSAWAVQVGSFTREDNANALRDRLRDADMDAYISEGRADGARVWRVRIGPLSREQEAHDLRDRLASERDIPGLVVSHP